MGFDIVVGHHAHVPQGIEKYNGGIIFYGLGNLCFDIPYHSSKEYTNESYFVEIDFLRNQKGLAYKKHFYFIDKNSAEIRLVKNKNTYNDFFSSKLQKFNSKREYKNAWTEEAYRVYIKSRRIKKFRLLSYAKNYLIDLFKKNKFPLVIGSIAYYFKKIKNDINNHR